ncbi:hypothetical protein PGQ11_008071 [Apiospora arundinis]|uniref:Zn(2)-C6 fungal-type domain-containing protein n=1 Tax=Apiospora arundinis TaxID=335852 RepID=A0ABR2IDW3_9PEZI
MVGVPGRSKACHTCRQRRVKCSGELPTCQTCAKSKRICTGYQRQYAFILSECMAVSGSAQSTAQLSPRSDAGSGSVMVSRWRPNQSKPFSRRPKNGSLLSEMPANPIHLPLEVSNQHVYRSRFVSWMVETDAPLGIGEGSNAYKTFGDRYDWSLQVLSLPSLTPALENALLAMSTARLGHHAGRPMLVRESLKLYTQSVAQVRRDILNDNLAPEVSEQSLAACLSLLSYEAIECPGKTMDGYQAHYRGCLELLQKRGAGSYASGLAHYGGFVKVILGNGPDGISFLAQSEWLDLPWSSQPDAKSLFDQLIDIMLQLPDLATQMQTLEAPRDPQLALRTAWRTIGEWHQIEDALEAWHESFRAAMPGGGPMYLVRLSQIDSAVDTAEDGKLFPVAFHFPVFMIGQALVYYWIALMSVQARLCYTYETLRRFAVTLDCLGRDQLPCVCETYNCHSDEEGDGEGVEINVETGSTTFAKKSKTKSRTPAPCLRHFDPDLLPRLERRTEWPWAIARNICQSAEYFLRDTNRGFGPASVLPALMWVRGFWERAPGSWRREIAWIDDMVGRIHGSGYGIAGAVLEQRVREVSLAMDR